MPERIDLDELARLEEERDFLLASIRDLEREHEVGDVDDLDFAELREGYLARAATVMHAIDDCRHGLDQARDERAAAGGRGRRAAMWGVGSVAFAVVAGLLLANALGSRGTNDQITGAGAIPRSATERCRGIRFDKTPEIIACWRKVLADEPDNVEALTYQGWAMVRGGDSTGGSKLFDRVLVLDPKYPDVRVFRATVAKNAGDFATANAELTTLYSLNPSPIIISTLQQMNLDTTIAEGLLPAPVKACWTAERASLEKLNAAAGASKAADDAARAAVVDLVLSLDCMDKALVAVPDNVDAMVMQALGLALLGEPKALERARSLVDRALVMSPANPDALLIRSAVLDKSGDPTAARADLDALGDRRTSPLYALIDRSSIRAQVEAELADSSTSTGAAAPSTTSVPSTTAVSR